MHTNADQPEGPSVSKRARIDLNDSFYDSEEDELVSQACAAPTEKVLQESFINNLTPQTPKSFYGSSLRPYQLPSSATTLKGKPLIVSTDGTPSSALADENDQSIIHTSKPFFRLAKEVKELTQERDLLKGQTLFLEQSLRGKEKESHDQVQKISDLTQKYTEALNEVREIQRRTDDEIVQLRTQLQFQAEQKKAGTFLLENTTNSSKESGVDRMTGTPMDADIRPVTHNVPKLKPRMSTSSVNKSFNSTLKPKPLTPSLNQQIDTFDLCTPDIQKSDRLDKGIQTEAFRLGDVITDTDILSKREKYDAIFNVMIGSSFIGDDMAILANGNEKEKRFHQTMTELMGIKTGEPSLNEIFDKK